MPKNKLKDTIGKLFGGQRDPVQQPANLAQTATISPPTITIQQNTTMPISTTNMTPEQLKARRIARVENARGLVESLHIRVMLKYVDVLCLVVPFAIVFLTTSELGQLFTGKAFNWQDQTSINMYLAALIAESVYAGCTFIWQYAESYKASLEGVEERARMERFTLGLALVWILFSAISAIGQFYYLKSFWHPKDSDVLAYTLIVARVAILIGADFACAKYLGWRVTTLRKLAQEEKARGEAYQEIEKQEARRREIEAESDLHLAQIDQAIETQKRNAKITNEVQEIMSQAATKFLSQFTGTVESVMNNVLENVNDRLDLPPAADYREIEGPKKEL